MHIAVCDDNIADRKQLERLLKRESDKRSSVSGILYTDSFGNADSLLANPMQYDAFYIDMCHTEDMNGFDVVAALTAKGVNAPIVMCCSSINYRERSMPNNVIFLDKPIQTQELSSSIDLALTIMEKADDLIELREDKETFYVQEEDILYAVEEGRGLTVYLADGRKIYPVTTAVNFFGQVEPFPAFVMATPKILLNCRHIQKLKFRKATMTDGAVFKIQKICMPYTKSMFEGFHKG